MRVSAMQPVDVREDPPLVEFAVEREQSIAAFEVLAVQDDMAVIRDSPTVLAGRMADDENIGLHPPRKGVRCLRAKVPVPKHGEDRAIALKDRVR